MGIAVENGTWQDFAAVGQRDREALQYKKEHGLLAYPNIATPHQKYGYYNLRVSPQEYGYDYSYTLPGMCCNPGLSFENGRSTEPAETWVRLQPYPETTPNEKYSTGGNNFPNTGYFGPSGFEEEGTDRMDPSTTSGGNGLFQLPGAQQQLVDAVVATKTPVVQVLINGGPLSLKAPSGALKFALLEAFYGAQVRHMRYPFAPRYRISHSSDLVKQSW